MFLFLVIGSALFLLLPYWIMRLSCDMLQIGVGNRRLRFVIFCLITWLTWDWFQVDPVLWGKGPDRNQIVVLLGVLFLARYSWLLLRGWRTRLAAEIRRERAAEEEKERAYTIAIGHPTVATDRAHYG